MKVLTVVYATTKGGTERTAVNFAIGYKKNQNDSRVLVTECNGFRDRELNEEGILIYSLSEIILIKQWSPDVVHVHSHGLRANQFRVLKNTLRNAHFVETNVFSVPSPWESDLTLSFQLSEWALMLYQERGGRKGVILPNAIQTDKWAIEQSEQNEPCCINKIVRVGRVGQNSPAKWSSKLINVLEKVKTESEEELEFVFVDPPEEFRAQVENSIIAKVTVLYPSIINEDKLQEVFRSIDIFVHDAEIGESFGMVLVEAALSNCDIVTFLTPWSDNTQLELVSDLGGKCANNYVEFKNYLQEAIKDRQSLNTHTIYEKYDYLKLSKKVLELIDSNNHPKIKLSPLAIYKKSGINLPIFYRFFISNAMSRKLLKIITGHTSFMKVLKRRLIKNSN